MAIAIATVTGLTGTVYARAEDGSVRQLQLGDVVFMGEEIESAAGASIELSADDGQLLTLNEGTQRLEPALAEQLSAALRELRPAASANLAEVLDRIL